MVFLDIRSMSNFLLCTIFEILIALKSNIDLIYNMWYNTLYTLLSGVYTSPRIKSNISSDKSSRNGTAINGLVEARGFFVVSSICDKT